MLPNKLMYLILICLLQFHATSAMAEKLCVSMVRANTSNSRIVKKSVPSTRRCPIGYTELIDTTKLRGDKGEPGQSARIFTATVNADLTLRSGYGVEGVAQRNDAAFVTFSEDVSACTPIVTQTGDEIGTIYMGAIYFYFATQHPSYPREVGVVAFGFAPNTEPQTTLVAVRPANFHLAVICH